MRQLKKGIIFGTALTLAGAAWVNTVSAEVELTDIKGNKLSCEVKEASADGYTLVANGRTFKITEADLAEESRPVALSYAKEKGVYQVFPPVTVEVMVATKRQETETSWMQNMSIEPSVNITGQSRLAPLPAAKATMVIVTMDTEKKYTYRTEEFKVHTNETIEIPAAGNGEKRKFDFKAGKVSFDAYRDKSNIGGAVYKYYIFGLVDEESGQIVDFQTNFPALAKLVKIFPQRRGDYLEMSVGKVFPEKLE